MLRRPKHSKNEVVVPKEEEDWVVIPYWCFGTTCLSVPSSRVKKCKRTEHNWS
jgi:hypothetical protein